MITQPPSNGRLALPPLLLLSGVMSQYETNMNISKIKKRDCFFNGFEENDTEKFLDRSL
jgi:hypothetical protein